MNTFEQIGFSEMIEALTSKRVFGSNSALCEKIDALHIKLSDARGAKAFTISTTLMGNYKKGKKNPTTGVYEFHPVHGKYFEKFPEVLTLLFYKSNGAFRKGEFAAFADHLGIGEDDLPDLYVAETDKDVLREFFGSMVSNAICSQEERLSRKEDSGFEHYIASTFSLKDGDYFGEYVCYFNSKNTKSADIQQLTMDIRNENSVVIEYGKQSYRGKAIRFNDERSFDTVKVFAVDTHGNWLDIYFSYIKYNNIDPDNTGEDRMQMFCRRGILVFNEIKENAPVMSNIVVLRKDSPHTPGAEAFDVKDETAPLTLALRAMLKVTKKECFIPAKQFNKLYAQHPEVQELCRRYPTKFLPNIDWREREQAAGADAGANAIAAGCDGAAAGGPGAAPAECVVLPYQDTGMYVLISRIKLLTAIYNDTLTGRGYNNEGIDSRDFIRLMDAANRLIADSTANTRMFDHAELQHDLYGNYFRLFEE